MTFRRLKGCKSDEVMTLIWQQPVGRRSPGIAPDFGALQLVLLCLAGWDLYQFVSSTNDEFAEKQ
jgi:hypothetical protein